MLTTYSTSPRRHERGLLMGLAIFLNKSYIFPRARPLRGYTHQSATADSFPQGKPLALGGSFVRTNFVLLCQELPKLPLPTVRIYPRLPLRESVGVSRLMSVAPKGRALNAN